MELFTQHTKVEDLIKYINWNLKFSDLVTPINKAGDRVIKKYPTRISPIEQFENNLDDSLPLKKKELIYAGLRYYKMKVNKILQITLPSTDSQYYEHEYEIYKSELFKLDVYRCYSQGDNPKLIIFKDRIIGLLENGLDEAMSHAHLGIPDDVDLFDTKPLSEIADNIFNFHIKKEIEEVIIAVDFIKYLENKAKELEVLPEVLEIHNPQLIWTGTPSQFGFIIDLLIQGGYIDKPTNSFSKDAEFYLKIFSINTTPGTLTKELSEKSNNLTTQNRAKFKIPHKDKLS